MVKRFLCGVAALFLCLSLCGCDLLTADTAELLSPPELSGDLKPIYEALKESAENDFVLKYPSRGNLRSAVVREDVDNDGMLEAFAFYSTTDDETITMNINAIFKKKDGWKSVSVQKIAAGGVDKVEFCDLDGDGNKEILVGWEIYGTSEMQLAVYNVTGESLTQRMLQKYTHFTTCDLDENGENEIFIVKAYSAEEGNVASIYKVLPDAVSEVSSCLLDSVAKTVNEPLLGKLSNGKPAFYIDEIKGMGAVTEVIFMNDGTLTNPMLSFDTVENSMTLRSVTFLLKDIDNDNMVEIPVQENVPSVADGEVNEKLYLINWCSYNGNELTSKLKTMMNVNEGYYLVIPPEWSGKIAVLKDTDARVREIYSYDAENSIIGDSLVYIKAVKKKDWDSGKYKPLGAKKIAEKDETVFVCKISDAGAAYGIKLDGIKEKFSFIE